MPPSDQGGNQAAWTGFLIVAFGVLGLVGAFGTYAAELPFDRAVARSATLDKVLAASHAPDPQAAEQALRPLLGDSADHVLTGPGTLESRVEAERARMLTDLHDEAKIYGFRLRCYLAVITVMASVFGALVMSFGRGRSTVIGPRRPDKSPATDN
jgi:hypothetical protein